MTAKTGSESAKDRQYQKFLEKARELETDESEENFDRVLKKVIKQAHPREDAPPMPTKRVVKSRPPKDDKPSKPR